MGAPRQKHSITRRRRLHDDEGEDDGSLAAGPDDDSSQASLPSEVDADADGEGSDVSDQIHPKKNGAPRHRSGDESTTAKTPVFAAGVADTEAMLNGMKIEDAAGSADAMDFEEAGDPTQTDPASLASPAGGKAETLAERRRREHEEYKKRRDADPAFVPNRGGFFMHDQRSSSMGQNGFRGAGPGGRGRGRGFGGPFPSYGVPHHASNLADAPWAHDLHETVVGNEEVRSNGPAKGQPPKPLGPPQAQPPLNRSFSRTVRIGNVQLRVYVAGMKEPIVFSAVPVSQYTRLPHHRPPLRRDKPVRISLPSNPPRYIFPSVDRSFIFIPRALRPNQQGFGRGRGRGSFGYPSARGSAYGGSVYSPSVAMSRRSSLAREIGRDGMVSPAGSFHSTRNNRSVPMDGGRPVVRLPPSIDPSGSMMPMMQPPPFHPTPVVHLPMSPSYMHLQQSSPHPQPQDPISQESLPANLPMYQPRPQKAVSVADIEAPGTHNLHRGYYQQQLQQPSSQPQQTQTGLPSHQLPPQPFHQQMPVTMNGSSYASDAHGYSHSRRPSHPSQRGTPLSQIPERAIHAQPFQPYPFPPQPSYYSQPFAAPVYYYPPTGPSMAPSVGAPSFVPGQQYPYMVPATGAPEGAQAGGGTVAHESNGMVYYYDPSQLPMSTEDPAPYTGLSYPSQGNYMMPPPAVYYPSQ